jgi:hypothetical protein
MSLYNFYTFTDVIGADKELKNDGLKPKTILDNSWN